MCSFERALIHGSFADFEAPERRAALVLSLALFVYSLEIFYQKSLYNCAFLNFFPLKKFVNMLYTEMAFSHHELKPYDFLRSVFS